MNSQSNSDLKTPGLKNNETLSVVKKARKQAEEDARLLTNRIALLKQEELRTIKKINETTKKAMEIYKIKEQNEKRWFQVIHIYNCLVLQRKCFNFSYILLFFLILLSEEPRTPKHQKP